MSHRRPGDTAVDICEWRPDLVDAATIARDVDMLADVLHAVVHGGAGVSFVVPFSLDDARAFWTESVRPGVQARQRHCISDLGPSRVREVGAPWVPVHDASIPACLTARQGLRAPAAETRPSAGHAAKPCLGGQARRRRHVFT